MHIRKLLSTTLIGGTLLFTGTSIQAETLQEAINGMLQSNPEVRSVAYNRLGRDQEVRQAKSGYFPTLEASAGIGYQDVQEPLDDTLYPQQYTLSLRQNVFAGLSTLNEVDRQKSRVRSAAYRLQGTSENSALRTSEVYLNVLRRQELLRLSEENLDTHMRIADQIKMRSDSGVASKADSDQVAGRVSLAQANVIATRTNLIDAHSNYLSIVGHLPTDLQKPGPVDKFLPASLKDAEEAAVKQHPTLKSATADLVARQQQYDVAKAPYFPIVDIEVDQNWTEDLDTDGKDASLIAMVRLRYNLFHGFRDEARRAETAHLISEAREIRNNTNRQVVESMRLSWMAYQAAQERIKFLEQRVASTAETAASYTKQFNLGKRTLLDVLDTEAEVIDAKQSLVEASYTGLYASYRILNGLGMLVKSFDLQWPKESQVEDEEKDQDKEQKDSKVKVSSEIRTFENRDSYLSAS
ncbi:MAG: TolC family outer membrane protein [Desulforhopalus sp.]|nr:TolC family outer membrane protein [Desulforhopalus sp.]